MLKALRSRSGSYVSVGKDDFEELEQNAVDIDQNASDFVSRLAPVADTTQKSEKIPAANIRDGQISDPSVGRSSAGIVSQKVQLLNTSLLPFNDSITFEETLASAFGDNGFSMSLVGENLGEIGSSESREHGSAQASINDTYNIEEKSIAGSEYDKVPKPFAEEPLVRTVSREGSIPMRHPTPDLQALQGAYVSNVERLEQSAERLSMNSDIGEALRNMKMDQKRSESRRSSILAAESNRAAAAIPPMSRQFSSDSHKSNSILRLNSTARSGGFSPSAYVPSPAGSLRSPSGTHHSAKERSSLQSQTRKTSLSKHPTPQSLLEYEAFPTESQVAHRSFSSTVEEPQVLHIANLGDQHTIDERLNGEHSSEAHQEIGDYEQLPYEEIDDFPEQSGYGEKYQRATNLFADFDGVHFTPHSHSRTVSKELSVRSKRSSLAASITSNTPRLEEAPPGKVYYPAPIPKEIMLPARLSKLPPANEQTRRATYKAEYGDRRPRGHTKSWLPDGHNLIVPGEGTQGARHSRAEIDEVRRRASRYWSHPSITQDIAMINGSAALTLDSILEASVLAPVTAFTDHPFAGRAGAEIYGPSEARDNTGNKLAKHKDYRRSKAPAASSNERRNSGSFMEDSSRRLSLLNPIGIFKRRQSGTHVRSDGIDGDEQEHADYSHEGTPLGGSSEVGSQDQNGELDTDEDEVNANEVGDEELYSGAPTTLLAELQLRKQQQKQRNRTAATQNGMYSTLLQMDAVAQVQKQARKQKQVTLAWEDPAIKDAGDDDEDVPLGVLFPGREANAKSAARFDENRPLGLIAQREFEDNETLAQRRARLRGEIRPRRSIVADEKAGTLKVTLPSEQKVVLDEVEGETLGQRRRRLQAANRGSSFTTEVMSQFVGPATQQPGNVAEAEVEDPNETLAQRRSRLKAKKEAEARKSTQTSNRPGMQKRHSMADLLTAYPAGSRTPSGGSVPQASGRGGPLRRQTMSRLIPNAPTNIQFSSPTAGPYQNVQYAYPTPNFGMMAYNNNAGQPMAYPNPFNNNISMGGTLQTTTNGYNGYNGRYANPLNRQNRTNQRQSSATAAPAVDPSQLAMIDRWRSSVMQ